MNNELLYEFQPDLAGKTLTIRREFAAPRPLVWECYTQSDRLDQWFAPKPLKVRTKSFDFSEGGHWHFAMIDADGSEYWNRVDYETIAPSQRYTALDGFSDADGNVSPDLPRSHQTLTFSDHGEHTIVETVVVYASAEDVQKVIDMGVEQGLASTLERLDELLATLT